MQAECFTSAYDAVIVSEVISQLKGFRLLAVVEVILDFILYLMLLFILKLILR